MQGNTLYFSESEGKIYPGSILDSSFAIYKHYKYIQTLKKLTLFLSRTAKEAYFMLTDLSTSSPSERKMGTYKYKIGSKSRVRAI